MSKRKNRRQARRSGARPPGQASAAERALVASLELLRQRRAPYAALIDEIVAETLADFPAASGAPVVEIGAGTGQLRGFLPAEARARAVHTDPSAAALRALVAAAPGAHALVASAAALPFAGGRCGAVLALCVFDAIAEREQPAVIDELARVLAPGGRFVHFLDMTTLLEGPFEKLAQSGWVPLPNVFGDPADEEWPLDLVLVQRGWLAGLLDFGLRTGHPLAVTFADDLAVFLSEPARFDVLGATRRFRALASDGDQRAALAALLGSASRLATRWGYPPFEPLPFHSGKYLASILETGFGNHPAFRVVRSEIRARSAFYPTGPVPAADAGAAGAGLDPPPRYRSLCLGHQRVMARLPERLLSDRARQWLGSAGGSRDGRDGETLTEAGVFVFVAERV